MNKVNLLSATYEDLVDLLGKPRNINESRSHILPDQMLKYTFDEGVLHVVMTVERCQPSPGDSDDRGWNVPEHRVEKLSFFFNTDAKVTLKDLNVQVDHLVEEDRSDRYNGKLTVYYSEEIGKRYLVDGRNVMRQIHLFPNSQKNRSLRCPKQ